VTPKGAGIYNNLTYEVGMPNNHSLITGSVLMNNSTTGLRNTDLVSEGKDVAYRPAVFENYGNNTLSALQAFYYTKPVADNKIEKTFGLISFSTSQAVIYLGVD
jgi:hypothetical protein